MKLVFTFYFSLRIIMLTKHRTLLKTFRSSPLETFLGKVVPKIWSRFTGEHACRGVISIKLQCNFIEITLRHECFPVNLLHLFRTTLPKNAYRGLFLNIAHSFPDAYSLQLFLKFCNLFPDVGSLWWVFLSLTILTVLIRTWFRLW